MLSLLVVLSFNSLSAEESSCESVESTIELVEEVTLDAWPRTGEEFEALFSKPVVFRGLVNDWEMMNLSYEYLYERYPDRDISFSLIEAEKELFAEMERLFAEGKPNTISFGREQPVMEFKEFWNKVKNGEIERYYITINTWRRGFRDYNYDRWYAQSINGVARTMALTYSYSDTLNGFFDLYQKKNRVLFLSGPGSVRLAHSHGSVFLAQIDGDKLVTLASPEDSESLYASTFVYSSPVNFVNPNLEKFPKAMNATFHQVVLKPGDVLFIPRNWLHEVRALTESISMGSALVEDQ